MLIQEAKQKGVIRQGQNGRGEGVSKTLSSLGELLGVESDNEAKNISSRSQKLAEHEPEEIEARFSGSWWTWWT